MFDEATARFMASGGIPPYAQQPAESELPAPGGAMASDPDYAAKMMAMQSRTLSNPPMQQQPGMPGGDPRTAMIAKLMQQRQAGAGAPMAPPQPEMPMPGPQMAAAAPPADPMQAFLHSGGMPSWATQGAPQPPPMPPAPTPGVVL